MESGGWDSGKNVLGARKPLLTTFVNANFLWTCLPTWNMETLEQMEDKQFFMPC